MNRYLILIAIWVSVATAAVAGHPALESYGLSEDTPLTGLYLVRGPGDLPSSDGVEVVSRRRVATLARLDAGVDDRLRAAGWAVIPLSDVPRTAPDKAVKTWTPVTEPNPVIQDLVDRVNWMSIIRTMSKVMRMNTRYSTTPGNIAAGDTIYSYFQRLGYSVWKDPFEVGGTTSYNVIGTKLGTVRPDSVYVMCAHYDAISEAALTYTPGADDNATGVAAVLLAAGYLADLPTAYTVKFACFSGEEQGLVGSRDWVQERAAAGLNIGGALNFDMLGWWEEGVHRELEVEVDPASQWLGEASINAANLYVPGMTCLLHVDAGAWWGDHASFWDYGYFAVNHEESWDWGDPDFNPYYHSTDDEIINLDVTFTEENVKIAIAAIATLAEIIPSTAAPQIAVGPRLSASPNPASGRVAMRVDGLTGVAPLRIQVVDLRGRVVAETTTTPTGGAANALWIPEPARHPAGTYMLRVPDRPDVAPVRISLVR